MAMGPVLVMTLGDVEGRGEHQGIIDGSMNRYLGRGRSGTC